MMTSRTLLAALVAAAAMVAPAMAGSCHDYDKAEFIKQNVATHGVTSREAQTTSDYGFNHYCQACIGGSGEHGKGALNPVTKGDHDCAWNKEEQKCYRKDKNFRSTRDAYATTAAQCEQFVHKQTSGTCTPKSVYIVRHGKVFSPSGKLNGPVKMPLDPKECVRAFHFKKQGVALQRHIDTVLANDPNAACTNLELYADGVNSDLKQTVDGTEVVYKRDPFNRCVETGRAILDRCSRAGHEVPQKVFEGGSTRNAFLKPRKDFKASRDGKSMVIFVRHIELVGSKDNDDGSQESHSSLLEDFGFDLPMASFTGGSINSRNDRVYSKAARDWTMNHIFVLKVAGDCAITRTVVPLTGGQGEGGYDYGTEDAASTIPSYDTLKGAEHCTKATLPYTDEYKALPYSEWIKKHTSFAW